MALQPERDPDSAAFREDGEHNFDLFGLDLFVVWDALGIVGVWAGDIDIKGSLSDGQDEAVHEAIKGYIGQ